MWLCFEFANFLSALFWSQKFKTWHNIDKGKHTYTLTHTCTQGYTCVYSHICVRVHTRINVHAYIYNLYTLIQSFKWWSSSHRAYIHKPSVVCGGQLLGGWNQGLWRALFVPEHCLTPAELWWNWTHKSDSKRLTVTERTAIYSNDYESFISGISHLIFSDHCLAVGSWNHRNLEAQKTEDECIQTQVQCKTVCIHHVLQSRNSLLIKRG